MFGSCSWYNLIVKVIDPDTLTMHLSVSYELNPILEDEHPNDELVNE